MTNATSKRLRDSYGFMLSANWLKYIAFALIAAVACMFLASWQDSRRKERNAEIAVIEANYDAPAVPLSQALPNRDSALNPEDEWTHVQITGTYQTDQAVLARNRSLSGTPGFYVIVPFVTQDGATILVARGWVPVPSESGTASAANAPQPAPGTVTLTGWLRPTEDGSKDDNPDGIIRAIDAARVPGVDISQAYAGAYVQAEAEEPAGQPGLSPLPEPSLDPGSHLSYTMQWIAFGLMIIIAVFVAARRERIHREELAATAGSGTGAGDAAAESAGYVVVDKDALTSGATTSASRYGASYRAVQKSQKKPKRKLSDSEYEDRQLDSQGL